MSSIDFNTISELLPRIAEGNQDAFKQLVNHYWSKLYTVAFTFLKSQESAKDTVQDVFLKVWVKREQLTGIQNIESWLFIVTRNEVITALKKRKRLVTEDILRIEHEWEEEESTDKLVNAKEINRILRQGIDLLPAQQQLIFKLSRDQGLSHAEICEQLNLARSTVKNSLVKTLAFLRNHLQQHTTFPAWVIFFLFFK